MAATPHPERFGAQLGEYSAWREELVAGVRALQSWIAEQELSDAQSELRIERLVDRLLNDDTLQVAFVAEFSRGKSELINAMFFAEFGQRVLPSSAGRTTMCPDRNTLRSEDAAIGPAASDRDAQAAESAGRVEEIPRRVDDDSRSISPRPTRSHRPSRTCRRRGASPPARRRNWGCTMPVSSLPAPWSRIDGKVRGSALGVMQRSISRTRF